MDPVETAFLDQGRERRMGELGLRLAFSRAPSTELDLDRRVTRTL